MFSYFCIKMSQMNPLEEIENDMNQDISISERFLDGYKFWIGDSISKRFLDGYKFWIGDNLEILYFSNVFSNLGFYF